MPRNRLKSWKKFSALWALLAALTLLHGCVWGESPSVVDNGGGGGGTEADGLYGTLADLQGARVVNARVRVFPDSVAGLAKTLDALAAQAAIRDSARTDAKGFYHIDSLPEGNYALLAATVRHDTTLTVLVRGIAHDGGKRNLGELTLRPGGKIVLKIHSEGATVAGARCSIAGLEEFSAVSSASGTCLLSGLPEGAYRVSVEHPVEGVGLTDTLKVKSGRTTNGGEVALAPVYSDALVAHWDFESDSDKILRDLTGRHDGVIVGNATLQSNGILGKSLALNSTGYVRVPGSPAFSGLSSFTLSAWVLHLQPTLAQPILEFSAPDTLGVHVWLNTQGNGMPAPGRVYANTALVSQAPSPYMHGTTAIADTGRWNHVVYTYDAATRAIRLFLNGALIAQSSLPEGTPAKSGDLYMGYRPLDSKAGDRGSRLQGRLDEVKIWSRALTPSEVQQAYDDVAKPTAGSTTVSLAPVADTYVNRSSTGGGVHLGNNFGAAAGFLVGVYDVSTIPTGLLQFTLPNDVTPARITKAVLRIHSMSGWTIKNVHPATVSVKAHHVLRAWKEGTGNGNPNSAQVDGVTALERFWGSQNGTEDWSQPSIGFDNQDVSSGAVATTTRANGYVGAWDFDLTSLAQNWAGAPAQNFGVLLRVDTPASDALVEDYPAFYSRESAVADSLKPRLILTLKP